MIEQLEYYTDTTNIQELDEAAAQHLYDEAMMTALALADDASVTPREAGIKQLEAQRYAIAAEEFAYAYYKQNDQKLDGAADPVGDFELEHTPPWAPKHVLTDTELKSKIFDYLKQHHSKIFHSRQI